MRIGFAGFREAIAGDGTIVYFGNGCAARLSSAIAGGSNRAILSSTFPAFPGVTYSARFSARLVSGSGETKPYLAVDYPVGPSLVERRPFIDDGQWHDYKLTFTAPFNANPATEQVIFSLGVFGGQAGVVEIANVVVDTDRRGYFAGTFTPTIDDTANFTPVSASGWHQVIDHVVAAGVAIEGTLDSETENRQVHVAVPIPRLTDFDSVLGVGGSCSFGTRTTSNVFPAMLGTIPDTQLVRLNANDGSSHGSNRTWCANFFYTLD